MDSHTIDVELGACEELNITPLSDIHLESRDCDKPSLYRFMKKRAALPNARFIGLGDTFNLVMPRDLKRSTPSVPDADIAVRDDYLNAVVERGKVFLSKYPSATWDMLALGNHEDECIKRHNFDVTRMLCADLGIHYGTYSGRLRYRITRPGGAGKSFVNFVIQYHHGAWGGQIIKGLGGARRWATQHGGWNVFLFGHNHHLISDWSPYIHHTHNESYAWDQSINACGAWQKSAARPGERPDYAERAGHPMVTLSAPLIKVWYERTKKEQLMTLCYSITNETRVRRIG